MSKQKQAILIVDEDQSSNMPFDLQGMQYLRYSISGDNTQFINTLTKVLQEWNEKKNEPSTQKDYLRLLEKAEYNASVIAAFRFLETTLSRKFDLPKPTSLGKSLSILNSNSIDDKEIIRKVRGYSKIRNSVVHTNENVSKKQATDIIFCIEKLCEAIQNGSIIML